MARKGDNIYRRKDGRWEGRYIKGYSPNSKPIFGYIYGREYQEVKQKLKAKKIEFGRGPIIGPAWEGSGKLESWAEHWLDSYVLSTIKSTTFHSYTVTVQNHIRPLLGEVQLSQITQNVVRRFLSILSEQGLSSTTIRNIYSLLKAMLRQAVEDGHLKTDPCRNIKLPLGRQKTGKCLTKVERRKLLKKLRRKELDAKLEMMLPLFCGLRVAELCALRMRDVDLDNEIILVNQRIQRVPRAKKSADRSRTQLAILGAKTPSSQREIPIPPPLLPLLMEKKEGRNLENFLLGPGEKPVEPRNVQRHFHTSLQEAGLDIRGMHALRHSFTALCLEAGADIITLSELLGHAGTAATFPSLEIPPGRKKQVIYGVSQICMGQKDF